MWCYDWHQQFSTITEKKEIEKGDEETKAPKQNHITKIFESVIRCERVCLSEMMIMMRQNKNKFRLPPFFYFIYFTLFSFVYSPGHNESRHTKNNCVYLTGTHRHEQARIMNELFSATGSEGIKNDSERYGESSEKKKKKKNGVEHVYGFEHEKSVNERNDLR